MQVGNLPRAGTAPVTPPHKVQTLHLVTPEALADARHWVLTWPEARGATNLLPALRLSSATWRHTDDVFLFSDGLVDDAAQALAFVEAVVAGGCPVPRFNCVALFAWDIAAEGKVAGAFRGKAFLQALAELTNGTFQEFSARGSCQVCLPCAFFASAHLSDCRMCTAHAALQLRLPCAPMWRHTRQRAPFLQRSRGQCSRGACICGGCSVCRGPQAALQLCRVLRRRGKLQRACTTTTSTTPAAAATTTTTPVTSHAGACRRRAPSTRHSLRASARPPRA
jgi:hypothetical protein